MAAVNAAFIPVTQRSPQQASSPHLSIAQRVGQTSPLNAPTHTSRLPALQLNVDPRITAYALTASHLAINGFLINRALSISDRLHQQPVEQEEINESEVGNAEVGNAEEEPVKPRKVDLGKQIAKVGSEVLAAYAISNAVTTLQKDVAMIQYVNDPFHRYVIESGREVKQSPPKIESQPTSAISDAAIASIIEQQDDRLN